MNSVGFARAAALWSCKKSNDPKTGSDGKQGHPSWVSARTPLAADCCRASRLQRHAASADSRASTVSPSCSAPG